MNQDRVNSIKKNFDGVGPNRETLYTNQEVVDLLQDIQRTMLTGVYEKNHAKYMRERDLMLHFSALAEQYGLKDTETYRRFEQNMNVLGHTIGSYIKGMRGERIARRSLKLLSFDKNVKILYNIALEDGEAQSEYDAIVIMPYGMFVVEVKNWGAEMYIDENGMLQRSDQDVKYDLPGRMSVKEGLLCEHLGELFPARYKEFLLFSNESAKVVDNYKKIPICFGGGIVYRIREWNDGTEILTEAKINEIAERILEAHKEQKSLCKVNCEEIIDDYAHLMAAMEEAAEGIYPSEEAAINDSDCSPGDAEQKKPDRPVLNILQVSITKKPKPVCVAIGLVTTFAAGFMTAKNFLFGGK